MYPNTVKQSSYGPIFDVIKKKSDIVLNAAAAAGHKITLVYGYNSTPDHNTKQCIDFMTYGNQAMAQFVIDYCKKNNRDLGVEGIIYNRRVMGFPANGPAYRGPAGGWRPYNGPNPHTDHVHIQFSTDALRAVGGTTASSSPSSGGTKAKPNSGWYGTLYVVAAVNAYDGTGKQRPEHNLKKGAKVAGVVDNDPFGDGRYFRKGNKPHALWYPLGDGAFSHTEGGAPIIDKDH